jgi:hypothetical protein
MRRILIGAATSLAVWLGSTMVAEAQGGGITPIGPTAYLTGSTTSTYTATITMPTPMSFKVCTYVYKNNVYQTSFSQNVPNPGTTTYAFAQVCDVTFSVAVGDVVRYEATLFYNRTTTNALPLPVTVTQGPTRPSKSDSIQRRSGYQTKPSGLALQAVDRDRRRE